MASKMSVPPDLTDSFEISSWIMCKFNKYFYLFSYAPLISFEINCFWGMWARIMILTYSRQLSWVAAPRGATQGAPFLYATELQLISLCFFWNIKTLHPQHIWSSLSKLVYPRQDIITLKAKPFSYALQR
jgi:hypothetical protein